MKINVYGLGYVGSVSAACLAKAGHDVVGIDVDSTKVDSINRGVSTVVEPGLTELIAATTKSRKLRAATSGDDEARVSMVCVGTPSNENGSLCLDYVARAAMQIGQAIAAVPSYHVVCVRSTVLPGTVEGLVKPLLEKHSGKQAGRDFGICMNPEFLREGTSIRDYNAPPFTIIGQLDSHSGDVVQELYSELSADVLRTPLATAEMVKYVCNAFHALKITFANEVGNLCKGFGQDGREVMSIVCRDDKLNISPAYLQPGFAFGGSCLPKDLRAILHRATEMDIDLQLMPAILRSNKSQVERAFRLIKNTGKKRVAVIGLSFKDGTDDLRESPNAELTEMLIGKGYTVTIYDNEVSLARLHGSNKAYIEHGIPHISSLLKPTLESTLDGAEVVVLAKKCPELKDRLVDTMNGRHVIDLVGSFGAEGRDGQAYEGICW